MADSSSSGPGSLLSNPNALLAVITIAGGLWLVSHGLTSSRPVTPAGVSPPSIGDQTLEARLWEDPFRRSTEDARTGKARDEDLQRGADMDLLLAQIRQRSGANKVQLMPVLLSGGQFGEDQESRVRSRYAIVSALGRAGYAPEDAEHIGAVVLPWLGHHEIMAAMGDRSREVTALWEQPPAAGGRAAAVKLLGRPWTPGGARMEVRFEWYRPRTFSPGSAAGRRPKVLVLWLDESNFEDAPLLRLALFLEPLLPFGPMASLDAGAWTRPVFRSTPEVTVIGPRRSSTLRAMLPDWHQDTTQAFPPDLIGKNLRTPVTAVLQRLDIYAATPSAMDEVLMGGAVNTRVSPRQFVGQYLTRVLRLKSFHNLAATDAQLAREIVDELALRHADLADTKNHLVLISEWDTFYARMLSLTYRSELRVRQQPEFDRVELVKKYLENADEWANPANFHAFVYLRGLDGQTAGGPAPAREGGEHSRAGTHPTSFEEIRHWEPDADKAQGQAQFDYLGRIGDQVAALQGRLESEGAGEIKAIGIVGSDVYDTLLILQALRHRFPAAIFFTTDLDVRFYHPDERAWARNLIVASSYGLMLHPDLQGEVAPFRDSTQTAQFAATLAALGNEVLAGISRVPPRRFEIGNRTAVDLSVDSVVLGDFRSRRPVFAEPWLHPLTPSERHKRTVGQLEQVWPALQKTVAAGRLALQERVTAGRRMLRAITRPAIARLAVAAAVRTLAAPPGAALVPALALARVQADQVWSVRRWTRWPTLPYGRMVAGLVVVALLLLAATWLYPPLRRATWTALRYLRGTLDYDEEDVGGPDGAFRVLEWVAAHPEDPIAGWLGRSVTLADLRRELGTLPLLAGMPGDVNWEREDRLAELSALLVQFLNQLLHRRAAVDEAMVPVPVLPLAADRRRGLLIWLLRRCPPLRRTIDCRDARRSLDAFLDRVSELPAVPGAPAAGSRLRRVVAEASRLTDATLDFVLGERNTSRRLPGHGADPGWAALEAAVAARESTQRLFWLRVRRLVNGWGLTAVFIGLTWGLALDAWWDVFKRPEGEPFSLTNGTSAWPAIWVRMAVFILAVCFALGLLHNARETALKLTRRFRLSPPPVRAGGAARAGCARAIWYDYRAASRFRRRMPRVLATFALYFALLMGISVASGEAVFDPTRSDVVLVGSLTLGHVVLLGAVIGFLLLAFLTIDAAMLCRRFIGQLSAAPTKYPEATHRHFSREMGRIDERYVDEWIDLQLIAELTERVGRLVYYPTVLFLLLLLARNSWWDDWTWPPSLVLVFLLNFFLALASVVILQRAAKRAKRLAEESLGAKVKRLQAQAAPNPAQNNATQAERLLVEIRALKRGAFVPFWENPVVGALFLSSGGTTAIQVLIWFMGR